MENDGLVSNMFDLEMDAGPAREPLSITINFCDAGVLVGLGNGKYGKYIPGGLGQSV